MITVEVLVLSVIITFGVEKNRFMDRSEDIRAEIRILERNNQELQVKNGGLAR